MGCKHQTDKWKPNGCGSKVKGWKGFTYYMIPDFVFEGCCDCHDYAYMYGGVKSIDDTARYKADREFYLQMKEVIRKKAFFRRPFLHSMAWTYYKAVRKFGQDSFNWFSSEAEWRQHIENYGFN
jgi:hypothetical protein